MQAQKDARFADVFGCLKSRMRSLLVVREREDGFMAGHYMTIGVFLRGTGCQERATGNSLQRVEEIPLSAKRNAEFLETRFSHLCSGCVENGLTDMLLFTYHN
ncbi:hypothetical protein CEXT_337591 [Caerostris extrusa]|uniref:Uncharacterized protein n=1 Tax=Caerostris extrusa TaxID=172846 RepID=A0AAV4QNB9_CAEEX|nr:hypothetical protein CEXT_337591 [Caerostris extrusa]